MKKYYEDIGIGNTRKRINYPDKDDCLLSSKRKLKKYIKSLNDDDINKNIYLIVYNHLYRKKVIKTNILRMIPMTLLVLSLFGLFVAYFVKLPLETISFLLQLISSVGTTGLIGLILLYTFNYKKMYTDKVENMKSQSKWREKIYEMEQKPIHEYRLNDLFILNSFINPYTSKGSASYIVNEMIYNLYFGRKEVVEVCRAEMVDILNTGFYKINMSSYHSLLTLKNSQYQLVNRPLTREEASDVKLCCHILLKAEWEEKI